MRPERAPIYFHAQAQGRMTNPSNGGRRSSYAARVVSERLPNESREHATILASHARPTPQSLQSTTVQGGLTAPRGRPRGPSIDRPDLPFFSPT